MGLFSGIGSALSGIGSILGATSSGPDYEAINRQNYEAQKEFAKSGVQWRVADAKAAGIHPLAALGFNGSQYSPSAVVGDTPSTASRIGSALSGLGQSVSRAAMAKQQAQDRALDVAYKEAQIEAVKADIALTQARTSQLVTSQTAAPPPMPAVTFGPDGSVLSRKSAPDGPRAIDGQAESGTLNSVVKVSPSETEANAVGSPGVSGASIPDISFSRTNDGGYAILRSSGVADRLDDDFVGTGLWHLRNSLPALFSADRLQPPKSWLPAGYDRWIFNPVKGAWYPFRSTNVHPSLKRAYDFAKDYVPFVLGVR